LITAASTDTRPQAPWAQPQVRLGRQARLRLHGLREFRPDHATAQAA